MARRKSLSTFDKEIEQLKQKIIVAKARHDRLCKQLIELQKKKELYMAEDLIDAMRKSGKTYEEIMTFLTPR